MIVANVFLFVFRRDDRIDHVELVLQHAVLLFQVANALEEFLLRRHAGIVAQSLFAATHAVRVRTTATHRFGQITAELR